MQLCEDCGANPATVHLTRIVNETTLVSHLCEECSRKKAIDILITNEGPMPEAGPEKDTACPRCQLKLSEFKTKGWLGCSECYRHFEKDIDSLLMQVHGSTVHKGKLYRHSGPDKLDIKDMERLKSELSEAIEKEEFELAALIRDTLHSFNTQNTGEARDQAR
jgi:protein arginine kinase activator